MRAQIDSRIPGVIRQIVSGVAGLLAAAAVIWFLIPALLPRASLINVVDGDSMLPTLSDGQLLFTDLSEIRRGDIVIAWLSGGDEDILVVKRVVAVPGDTVTVNAEGLFVNSQLVDEEYLTEESKNATYIESGCNYRILAKDEYYLLGDNRAISYDSRYHGPVRAADIVYKQSVLPTVNTVVRLILAVGIVLGAALLYVGVDSFVNRLLVRKKEDTKES